MDDSINVTDVLPMEDDQAGRLEYSRPRAWLPSGAVRSESSIQTPDPQTQSRLFHGNRTTEELPGSSTFVFNKRSARKSGARLSSGSQGGVIPAISVDSEEVAGPSSSSYPLTGVGQFFGSMSTGRAGPTGPPQMPNYLSHGEMSPGQFNLNLRAFPPSCSSTPRHPNSTRQVVVMKKPGPKSSKIGKSHGNPGFPTTIAGNTAEICGTCSDYLSINGEPLPAFACERCMRNFHIGCSDLHRGTFLDSRGKINPLYAPLLVNQNLRLRLVCDNCTIRPPELHRTAPSSSQYSTSRVPTYGDREGQIELLAPDYQQPGSSKSSGRYGGGIRSLKQEVTSDDETDISREEYTLDIPEIAHTYTGIRKPNPNKRNRKSTAPMRSRAEPVSQYMQSPLLESYPFGTEVGGGICDEVQAQFEHGFSATSASTSMSQHQHHALSSLPNMPIPPEISPQRQSPQIEEFVELQLEDFPQFTTEREDELVGGDGRGDIDVSLLETLDTNDAILYLAAALNQTRRVHNDDYRELITKLNAPLPKVEPEKEFSCEEEIPPEHEIWVRVRRGEDEKIANFSNPPLPTPAPDFTHIHYSGYAKMIFERVLPGDDKIDFNVKTDPNFLQIPLKLLNLIKLAVLQRFRVTEDAIDRNISNAIANCIKNTRRVKNKTYKLSESAASYQADLQRPITDVDCIDRPEDEIALELTTMGAELSKSVKCNTKRITDAREEDREEVEYGEIIPPEEEMWVEVEWEGETRTLNLSNPPYVLNQPWNKYLGRLIERIFPGTMKALFCISNKNHPSRKRYYEFPEHIIQILMEAVGQRFPELNEMPMIEYEKQISHFIADKLNNYRYSTDCHPDIVEGHEEMVVTKTLRPQDEDVAEELSRIGQTSYQKTLVDSYKKRRRLTVNYPKEMPRIFYGGIPRLEKLNATQ